MIILDKKSYDLLSYLMSLNEPETIMAMSKKRLFVNCSG